MKRLPIGISDFKKLIENDYLFVDTTKMIADVFAEPSDIILITRPRRFGKTLNMSMLSYFFDNAQQTSHLFKGLDISHDNEVMKGINAYPTIFITFKDIKNGNWKDALKNLKTILSNLYKEKEPFLKNLLKDGDEYKYYRSIIEMTASEVDYQNSLKNLIQYLEREYDKKVLLIIDEYDIPIQSGWTYGYYDDVIDFMRVFLSAALKDNANLFKGVLTGIYRVAKESIFSGLNNLSVFTVLNKDYVEYFGFTEEETVKIIKTLGMENIEGITQGMKEWYNGYRFGDETVYNPWSVLNYLRFQELKPYWINTSSNDLIISLIEKNMKGNEVFRKEIERLISGETIEKHVDETSALRELEYDPNSIWTLFLFSGYIKAENKRIHDITSEEMYDCCIPNMEVMRFYKKTVLNWLRKPDYYTLTYFTENLVKGNGEEFCQNLKSYVMETLSYFDIEKKSENTYHILLLGMFSHLQGGYWIKSNRESGKGRYDVLLKAKDKKNYSAVIEIKADASKEAVEEAMSQIEKNEYAQELKSEGYTRVLKVALGVDGKRVEALVRE